MNSTTEIDAWPENGLLINDTIAIIKKLVISERKLAPRQV
jgi:hypothetical protein